MNILKFVVCSKVNSIGLFPSCINDGYLCRFSNNSFGIAPEFNSSEPVLFRFSHARFLSRELRRSGYFVSVSPYLFVVFKQCFVKLRLSFNERLNARKKWRK